MKMYIIIILFTFVVDALLFRFALVVGTLADEAQSYAAQFDVIFGLVVFLITTTIQLLYLRKMIRK